MNEILNERINKAKKELLLYKESTEKILNNVTNFDWDDYDELEGNIQNLMNTLIQYNTLVDLKNLIK